MASLLRVTPKSHPPQLKADAGREEREGRLPQAIRLLEQVLRLTPGDWPTVRRLADLRARQGSGGAAADLYRRLAEHYEDDDHLSRAIAAWRLVLRHDPEFAGGHVKLGELYARQGFRVESERHHEAAVAAFEGQGRTHEAAVARRDLEAARGETRDEPVAASAPLLPDEEELVAERLVEAKMYRRYKLLDRARTALETVLGKVPDHPEARAELAELERDEAEKARDTAGERQSDREARAVPEPVSDRPSEPAAPPADDPDLESLEFTLELEENLFDDVPTPSIDRGHVEAQIGPEDYGARYDLGIAYREMGLIDEAIAELQLASRDPQRLIDCASLLAGCFVERGLPALAVQWLERGLEADGCSEKARHALRYELGAVLEEAGETERALDVFTALYGEAAGHRDVAARIGRLRGRPGEAADVEKEE